MTTRPPADPTGLASRGVRLLAVVVVALIAAAAGAVAGPGRLAALVVVTVLLVAAGVVANRQQMRGVASSALVAAALVALLAAEEALHPTGRTIDVLLWASGAVFLAAGYGLRERRLAVVGLLQWAVALGRPLPDGPSFQHCLVLTDLVVPVPRLLPPLALAVVAVGVGTWHRWSGRASVVGRGIESVGAIGTAVLLVALAAELPGHRAMCGPGDAVDAGWALLAIAVGLVMIVYGLAGRDQLWAASGVVAVALTGLVGTVLAASPWWALIAAAPLVAGLVAADRAGVGWPTDPGYGRARPMLDDVTALIRRARTSR